MGEFEEVEATYQRNRSLRWDEHWRQTREVAGLVADSDPENHAADWAISTLLDAGVVPEDADREDVSRAQTYLQMAAMLVPGLMDLDNKCPTLCDKAVCRATREGPGLYVDGKWVSV